MRRGQLERGIALDLAKQDIAARIRPVCRDFDEAEFRALVERMAEIDVRYRLRDDWLAYRVSGQVPAVQAKDLKS